MTSFPERPTRRAAPDAVAPQCDRIVIFRKLALAAGSPNGFGPTSARQGICVKLATWASEVLRMIE